MITLFEKFYKKGLNITYSAVILDEKSQNLLLSTLIYPNEEFSEWNKIAHHQTICMGELPEHLKRYWLNEEISLTATEIGSNENVVAVKVTGSFVISKPTDKEGEGSKFPHITLAVNPNGGKPADSNNIINWSPIKHLKLKGVVKEVQR